MERKEPKRHTGKKPLIYYSVFAWSSLEKLADQHYFCTGKKEAIAKCKEFIDTGSAVSANVRKETVYRLTDTCDYSFSSPIFSI